MNKNILALMPVFVFMIIMLIVSIYVRRASAKKASEGFVKDYFIGSRSLGGFVLAMTTVATYKEIIQSNIRKEQISPKTSSFRGFLYIPINLSDTTKTHEISTVTNT